MYSLAVTKGGLSSGKEGNRDYGVKLMGVTLIIITYFHIIGEAHKGLHK